MLLLNINSLKLRKEFKKRYLCLLSDLELVLLKIFHQKVLLVPQKKIFCRMFSSKYSDIRNLSNRRVIDYITRFVTTPLSIALVQTAKGSVN